MRRIVVIWMAVVFSCAVFAQGTPFLRNYNSDEYRAHNRNFDIITDDAGHVFVANFEGLLYYDKTQWRIAHTPGTNRITSLYRDSKGIVWVGGFNYLGKVVVDERGSLQLQRMVSRGIVHGEVNRIWEQKGDIAFLVGDSVVYSVSDGNAKRIEGAAFVSAGKMASYGLNKVLQQEPLADGMQALVTDGNGIVVIDKSGKQLFSISEQNGLCSNNVSRVAYDGHGILWGATSNGVFAVLLPSAYSHFTANEGLRGEVLSIMKMYDRLYVGTLSGLFCLKGTHFEMVGDINHACWELAEMNGKLLAATSEGVFTVAADGIVRLLNETSTMSLLVGDDCYYSGELDGVYLNSLDGTRKKVCPLENVTHIVKDAEGTLWLQSLDAQVWSRKESKVEFTPYQKDNDSVEAATLVAVGHGKVAVVDVFSTHPFPYPQFSYTDKNGVAWLTDNGGYNLYAWQNGKRLSEYDRLLHPLAHQTVRAMLREGDRLWVGGKRELYVVDCAVQDPLLQIEPTLKFRAVTLRGDSLLWGGFGTMPKELPPLSSDDRHIQFSYSLDYTPILGHANYRYRINGGKWTAWEMDGSAEFPNLYYGSYLLEVQARDAMGRLSEIVGMQFSIDYPFYMRSYMLALYVALAALLVYFLVRLRLQRLQKEKIRLEEIVQERTSEIVKQKDEIVMQRDEIVKQKDEIEEKSKSLETALAELHQAQGELIRQEKMATVGKLTQGLIDRILNPLNYINNFSKLSEGLVKDIEANIEDDKDKMDEENYEDTMDVLGMLRGNLQKVGEHGQNTTRTLKAMEEMLKDRSGGIVPMDLAMVLRQNEEMLRTYYADDMTKYGIKATFNYPDGQIPIKGNADQLSKTFMSMLGNAVYAVVKKAQREKYQPEVQLRASVNDDKVIVSIRDNGIGIEETIINKVFDPFFTTKTTGEAAGVGLYLSREIVQNHGGDIAVESVKNKFTEFTIHLPI